MFFKDQKLNTMILSIIWGLGISALFRRVCDNNKCIVVKAPKGNQFYENKDGECFEFIKEQVECENFEVLSKKGDIIEG